MVQFDHILAKSAKNGGIPLVQHLQEVAQLAELVAEHIGLDKNTARKGAILHDIGKTSLLFQETLKEGYQYKPNFVFRHELASLFFISLLHESEIDPVIEMIVAHHKSVYKDIAGRGILDLVDNDPKWLDKHYQGFEIWQNKALAILKEFGFVTKVIAKEEALENIQKVVDYCESKKYGYSEWKGVLIAADHMASALSGGVDAVAQRLFITPNLDYYHSRKSTLYPLSLTPADDQRRHTLVTAPTGAGKTDFLFRRCHGRVFYTLPFQASINAMYDRIKDDLKSTNADVRLLHASSSLKLNEKGDIDQEKILQHHVGASVKVLTPHQMASLVFATKGYEALIVDLKGCDVILDEIHTYSDTIQAIVLKIVEILCNISCRVHIGTATMPSILYTKLVELLGGKQNVYEVKLRDDVLETFNRHTIYKASTIESLSGVIEKAVEQKQKILLVCNQVKRAQCLFQELAYRYPHIKKMLIHSRFKRGKRSQLEDDLRNVYNQSTEACLVVSTQVVEVSLDISFDLMITECAPIDALIQRFGRINRKRTTDTIGHYKPIYVLQPPNDKKDALPYSLEVLQRTYQSLPNGELLCEKDIQVLIDNVYPEIEFEDISLCAVYKDGKWIIKELRHNSKSALLEALDIDAVTCVLQGEDELYEQLQYEDRLMLEIPVSFFSVGYRKLDKAKQGSKPFIIPTKAYDEELGFLVEFAKPEYYDTASQFL